MLLISLTLSFSSCGSKAPMEEIKGAVDTTSASEPEATETKSEAEPTAEAASTDSVVYTPTPTSTPTATPTTTSESSDKSVDEIAAEESYTLSEQEKADLRALGATEEQINNVKSGQDFVDLVYKLVDSGSNTGNSGTITGGGSSSNESDSFGDEVHDPSRVPQLPVDDGSLHGSMGSGESESDPWGDIPATPLDDPSTAPAGRM